MRRQFSRTAFCAALAVLLVSGCKHEGPEGREDAAGEAHTQLHREPDGSVVLALDDDALRRVAAEVAQLAADSLPPEYEAYGRVLDPGPFLGLAADKRAAVAALDAASKEVARSRQLASHENASARTVEAAVAAESQAQAAFEQLHARLSLGWGDLLKRNDLAEILRALVAREAVLVRVDVPSHQDIAPLGVRFAFVDVPTGAIRGQLVGLAPEIDEKLQGKAYLALVQPNAAGLVPGVFLLAHLELEGETEPAVLVPRSAIVRTEGKPWIYLPQAEQGRFRRVEVTLDRAASAGWLVRRGAVAGDRVVIVGAQQLLSEEARTRERGRD